jgi:hypothetical protein
VVLAGHHNLTSLSFIFFSLCNSYVTLVFWNQSQQILCMYVWHQSICWFWNVKTKNAWFSYLHMGMWFEFINGLDLFHFQWWFLTPIFFSFLWSLLKHKLLKNLLMDFHGSSSGCKRFQFMKHLWHLPLALSYIRILCIYFYFDDGEGILCITYVVGKQG